MSRYCLDWLITEQTKDSSLKFIHFWSSESRGAIGKDCFSQWFPAAFVVNQITYRTAEHWMMAKKALLFNDTDIHSKILTAVKPGEAKALGREIQNYDEEIWQKSRMQIVIEGNLYKFSQHPELKTFLLSSGDRVLVEASPVDFIWGCGLSQDDPAIQFAENWKGTNLLGFALMEVRDILRRS